MPTSTNVTNLKINELTEAQYDAAVLNGTIGANELSVLTDAQVGQIIQVSSMPTAGADELGNIYQFIGTTDANYTNGYFYKCVSDGGNPATYSWERTDVQPTPSELPSQTGNAGKFLTTDGTDASWSDKPLVNTATGTNSITVDGTAVTYNNSINIGKQTQISGFNAVAIGYGAQAAKQAIGLGSNAKASGEASVAIGIGATASGNNSIQISAKTNYTNFDANTFKVANANGNFEIMSADGTIPTDRLTKVNSTITLTAAGWSSNTQTVTVNGVTSTSVVLVAPDPSDTADYVSAGILCTSQATNSLTFTATTTPTTDIDVNIVCL